MSVPPTDDSAARRLRLRVGILAPVFALAAWAFAELAQGVMHDDALLRLDAAITLWMQSHAVPVVTRLMLGISDAHRPIAIFAIAAAVVVVLWRRQERLWAAAFAIVVPGGIVLNTLLKLAFHRARPRFENPLVVLETFSFPSGHVVGATVLYAMLCACALPRLDTNWQRMSMIAAALVMVCLVAMSRLYLGAHFLSDVLAAFCEGIAWVTVCVAAMGIWERRV